MLQGGARLGVVWHGRWSGLVWLGRIRYVKAGSAVRCGVVWLGTVGSGRNWYD